MTSKIQDWEQIAERVRTCRSVADVLTQSGSPHHKDRCDGFEIWHYPLGVDSGLVYSIHVCVSADKVEQAYLYFEPTSDEKPA